MKRTQSFINIVLRTILLYACYVAVANAIEVSDDQIEDDDKLQTPQPPVIEPQSEPVYEPKNTDDTAKEATLTDKDQSTKPTAQPPLKEAADKQQQENNTTKSINNTEDQVNEPVSSTNTETNDTEVEDNNNSETEVSITWLDTRPDKVIADWLQLKSGEWLRGRIIILQKNHLEFDSDELNNIEFKWNKVKYLKSYEPYRLRFDGREIIVGTIEITENEVHVFTDYEDLVLPRNQLQTIASAQESEISYWSSKVTFSINVRRGNTDQTDFTSKINAKRRTTESRLVIDYLGNFTEVQDTDTINNHRLNATLDYFITRRLFWTMISAEFFRDPFQNIEERVNISTAAGYALVDTLDSEWNVSLGPGYQETNYVSVQPGDPQKDASFVLIFNTNFDTKLNSKVDIEGLYTATLGDNNTGNYTHHSIVTVETELTDKLDLDVSFVWDHIRSPVADQNNELPENDDFRILIGLGYDL